MTKSELKNGMVVELRNSDRYMVVGDKLVGAHSVIDIFNECYGENLRYETLSTGACKDLDVMKVYDDMDTFEEALHCNDYEHLIWKRKVPKKMTLKEIEEALGYPVEIVRVGQHDCIACAYVDTLSNYEPCCSCTNNSNWVSRKSTTYKVAKCCSEMGATNE